MDFIKVYKRGSKEVFKGRAKMSCECSTKRKRPCERYVSKASTRCLVSVQETVQVLRFRGVTLMSCECSRRRKRRCERYVSEASC